MNNIKIAKDVSSNSIESESDLLSEASAKIKAVLTLILGGDKVAAEYCLISLVSRVFKKESSFLIGNVPLNLTGISQD